MSGGDTILKNPGAGLWQGGVQASTITSGLGAGSDPWKSFFGQPQSAGTHQPMDDVSSTTYIFPQAMVGKSEYLGQVFTRDLFLRATWPMLVLPPQVTNDITIRWDEWDFSRGFMPVVPELGVGRILASVHRQGGDTLMRRGRALHYEHGFLNTPEGKRHFVESLRAIADSVSETNNFGVINALYQSLEREDRLKTHGERVYAGMTVRQLIKDELGRWGILNTQQGFKKLNAEVDERMLLVEGHGNTWILTPQAAIMMEFQPAITFNALAGPSMLRYKEDSLDYFSEVWGNRVYLTRAMEVRKGITNMNPLRMEAQIGEFFALYSRFYPNGGRLRRGATTGAIEKLDEGANTWHRITVLKALEMCNRFMPTTTPAAALNDHLPGSLVGFSRKKKSADAHHAGDPFMRMLGDDDARQRDLAHATTAGRGPTGVVTQTGELEALRYCGQLPMEADPKRGNAAVQTPQVLQLIGQSFLATYDEDAATGDFKSFVSLWGEFDELRHWIDDYRFPGNTPDEARLLAAAYWKAIRDDNADGETYRNVGNPVRYMRGADGDPASAEGNPAECADAAYGNVINGQRDTGTLLIGNGVIGQLRGGVPPLGFLSGQGMREFGRVVTARPIPADNKAKRMAVVATQFMRWCDVTAAAAERAMPGAEILQPRNASPQYSNAKAGDVLFENFFMAPRVALALPNAAAPAYASDEADKGLIYAADVQAQTLGAEDEMRGRLRDRLSGHLRGEDVGGNNFYTYAGILLGVTSAVSAAGTINREGAAGVIDQLFDMVHPPYSTEDPLSADPKKQVAAAVTALAANTKALALFGIEDEAARRLSRAVTPMVKAMRKVLNPAGEPAVRPDYTPHRVVGVTHLRAPLTCPLGYFTQLGDDMFTANDAAVFSALALPVDPQTGMVVISQDDLLSATQAAIDADQVAYEKEAQTGGRTTVGETRTFAHLVSLGSRMGGHLTHPRNSSLGLQLHHVKNLGAAIHRRANGKHTKSCNKLHSHIINDSHFGALFKEMSSPMFSDLESMVLHIYATMPFTLPGLQAMAKSQMVLPVGFLIFQPHMRYRTDAAIKVWAGKETGVTYMRPGQAEVGNNTQDQSMRFSFTYYSKASVRRKQNVYVAPDASIYDYLGGNGAGPIVMKEAAVAQQKKNGQDAPMPEWYNPHAGKYSAGSYFVVMTPMAFLINDDYDRIMDLVGRFDPKFKRLGMQLRDSEEKHYPTAWFESRRNNWLAMQTAPYESSAADFKFSMEKAKINTVMHRGHTRHPDPETHVFGKEGFVDEGVGHWTETFIGCPAVRLGRGKEKHGLPVVVAR
jgi:hypothetical protein